MGKVIWIVNEYNGPIRYNYELLMNEKVVNEIVQLVIKAVIKFKRMQQKTRFLVPLDRRIPLL